MDINYGSRSLFPIRNKKYHKVGILGIPFLLVETSLSNLSPGLQLICCCIGLLPLSLIKILLRFTLGHVCANRVLIPVDLFQVDPNTGVAMYESDDIIKYLVNKYGLSTPLHSYFS